ncbi:anti-sigma factor [Blastococcus sp. SYSU D00669]
MPHCTPEQLALAALREPLPAPDAQHLAACAACAREVAALRRSVDALAVPQLAAPAAPVPPPPSVWEGIAAQTGVSARPRPEVVASPLISAPEPPPVAPVVPLRRRRRPLLVAAAAAAVVAVAGGTAVVVATRDDATVVAAAALDPLDDASASGTAEVVVRDGERVLEVRLDAAAPDDGYYEVWLIDERVEGMYSLGVVRAGTTDLPVPAGVDLAEYPIVDVSVEPLDGDPTHSGVSVARGVLES